MVYKEHLIELWVNGNKVELEDQKSINMRFNNVLFDPTKISSNQAEYSFEFEVPATPKNNAIFDYANNLSKLNKFHQRYNAEVYADGTVIFSGTITINGYKDKKYSLNLVSVKVYSLEDIFGDMTMNKIKDWKINFDGVPTINQINAQSDTEVVFPLVSYGVFQKNPKVKDEVKNEYTSKYDIDEYAKFYVEDFYPSHNMLATLRHAFESKGYTVVGDAFTNTYLKNIYMSVNLADEQIPTYNLGNKLFGEVSMNVNWQTPISLSSIPYTQSLEFPYGRIGGKYSVDDGTYTESNWNFSDIQVYDMMDSADGGNYTFGNGDKTYMFNPEEKMIVIPADGFYKISLDALATLSPSQSALTATQYYKESRYNHDVEQGNVTIPVDFKTTMPLEIQLVRNYDDNIELIKGKNNILFENGKPEDLTWADFSNRYNTTTCFPHEQAGSVYLLGGWIDTGTGYKYSTPTDMTKLVNGNSGNAYNWLYNVGYIYNDASAIMAYDQAVSPAFICGFTSMGNDNGGGCAAIMRDGYSWTAQNSTENHAFYVQNGYDGATTSVGFYPTWELTTTPTEHNKNEYIDSPTQSFSETNTEGNRRFIGSLNCMVYLNKDDKIKLFAVQRDYVDENGTQLQYSVAAIANLKITAASPKEEYQLRNEGYGYRSESQFDKQLNLANFFNKEKKVSDWIQNVVDAYNLEVIQNGNIVEINVKKKIDNNIQAAVDIDDRTNSDDAEAKAIDYPKSMAVKYKIDTDEWGFEQTAEKRIMSDDTIPDEILNDEDAWKKYGDSGYTVIKLNDDSYATSTSDKSLQFSYTWYQDFNWYATTSAYTKESDNAVVLKLPCISKYEYMNEGYDYEESMKHDGYGLAQRFWIKPKATNQWVWTRTYPPEQVWIYEPTNLYTNYRDVYFNLSYKDTEDSILTNFFNINAYLASNYVEIEVYLSADEYNRIKNGSLVHFDSDLYYPVEISGYDPSGYNPTTLKLMKKVN